MYIITRVYTRVYLSRLYLSRLTIAGRGKDKIAQRERRMIRLTELTEQTFRILNILGYASSFPINRINN